MVSSAVVMHGLIQLAVGVKFCSSLYCYKQMLALGIALGCRWAAYHSLSDMGMGTCMEHFGCLCYQASLCSQLCTVRLWYSTRCFPVITVILVLYGTASIALRSNIGSVDPRKTFQDQFVKYVRPYFLKFLGSGLLLNHLVYHSRPYILCSMLNRSLWSLLCFFILVICLWMPCL